MRPRSWPSRKFPAAHAQAHGCYELASYRPESHQASSPSTSIVIWVPSWILSVSRKITRPMTSRWLFRDRSPVSSRALSALMMFPLWPSTRHGCSFTVIKSILIRGYDCPRYQDIVLRNPNVWRSELQTSHFHSFFNEMHNRSQVLGSSSSVGRDLVFSVVLSKTCLRDNCRCAYQPGTFTSPYRCNS